VADLRVVAPCGCVAVYRDGVWRAPEPTNAGEHCRRAEKLWLPWFVFVQDHPAAVAQAVAVGYAIAERDRRAASAAARSET
jgi:hypothetical protein